MSSVSHLHLLIVLALYACLQTADGVNCEKDSDCVLTDFTLPKCQEGGVCQCKAPNQPINSGCGKKIAKPTLSFEGASSLMVWAYEGASVLLDCSTSDLPSSASYYIPAIKTIWQYGGEKLEETSGSLRITISSTTVASPYTCAVIPFGGGPISSEFSDPFKITMVKDKAFPDGSWKPKLHVTKKAMEGVELPMWCTNYPEGKPPAGGFEDKYYTTASSSPIQNPFTFEKKVELYCKVSFNSDGTKSRESDRVTVTLAENLAGVTISVSGEHASSYTYKTGVTKNLKCQDNGDVVFNTSAVEYLWTIGSKTVQGKGGSYSVNLTKPGSTTYTCSMKVGDRDPVESKSITITVEDEPLPDPVIEVTPKVATPGSHVSLACGKKDTTGSLTYMWIRFPHYGQNARVILAQSDRVIQYHNIGLATDKYKCRATTKDGYFADSMRASIVVKPNKPTLTVVNSPKTYYRGEPYTLNCTSSPTGKYLASHFFRNGKVLSITDHSLFTLWTVKNTDSGNYTCQAKLFDTNSDVSNSVMISVEAPGKHCDTKDDCKGKEFSGNCAESRCVCQSGYKAEGSGCSLSSATLLKVSLLGLTFALMLSLRIL